MTRLTTIALVASLALTSMLVEANKLHAIREALARIHTAHEYSRAALDTRTKAGTLQINTMCPDGSMPKACLVDPCRSATCASNPNAQCVANYCGGCNAIFYDSAGKPVAGCGAVPDCSAIQCSQPLCGPGQQAVTVPTQCCPVCGPATTVQPPPPTVSPPSTQQTCRADQEWQTCGSSCPPTCGADPNLACTANCVAGCFCKAGTLLDPATGACVTTCPTKPDCSAVACPAIGCGPGSVSVTPPGSCCPICQPSCLDGSAPVRCLTNPCSTATCASNPAATCKPDYCGGCNAIFWDANFQPVAGCGAVPDCSTVRCANPSCIVGFKAVKPLTSCCLTCVPDTMPPVVSPPVVSPPDMSACEAPFLNLMLTAECSDLAGIVGSFSSSSPPSVLTLQRFCASTCISKLVAASKSLTGDCSAFGGMVQWVVQAVCMRDESNNYCYPQLSRLEELATTNSQNLAAPTQDFLQSTCSPCTRKMLSTISALPPNVATAMGGSMGGGMTGGSTSGSTSGSTTSGSTTSGSTSGTGTTGSVGSSPPVDVDTSLQQLDLLCTTSGGKDNYCAVALSGITNQVSAAAGIGSAGPATGGATGSTGTSSGTATSGSTQTATAAAPTLVTSATADETTLNLAAVGTFADPNWVQSQCQNRCFQKMAVKAASMTASTATVSTGSVTGSTTTAASNVASIAVPADPTKSLKYQCVRDDQGNLCVPRLQSANLEQATCDQVKAAITSAGCCAGSYMEFMTTAADSATVTTMGSKLSTCGITLPTGCPVTRGNPAKRSITLHGDVATLTQPKMRNMARIDIATKLGIASDFVEVGEFVVTKTASAKMQAAQTSSGSTGTVTAPVTISGSSQTDIDAAAADFDSGVDLTSVNTAYVAATGSTLAPAPVSAPAPTTSKVSAATKVGISVASAIALATAAFCALL